MNLFKKTNKLEHTHLQELALLCGGVVLLLAAAFFVSNFSHKGPLEAYLSPATQSATAWWGVYTPYKGGFGAPAICYYHYNPNVYLPQCPNASPLLIGERAVFSEQSGSQVFAVGANSTANIISYATSSSPLTVVPGVPVTLNWACDNYVAMESPSVSGDDFNGTPSEYTPNFLVFLMYGSSSATNFTGSGALIGTSTITAPSAVGTYSYALTCNAAPDKVYNSDGSGTACDTAGLSSQRCQDGAGLTVKNAPIVLTLNVNPVTANATAASPVSTGQNVNISFHADSISSPQPSACEINNFDNSQTLYTASGGCPTSANDVYSFPVATPGVYAYNFWYNYQGTWIFSNTVTVVVNHAQATPSCGLTASATTVPAGTKTTLYYSTDGTSASIDQGVGTLPVASNPTVKSFTAVGPATWVVPTNVSSAQILAVAGGGGGGAYGGGGGGAGGVIYNGAYALAPGNVVNITVGAGGTAGTNVANGSNGNDSLFDTQRAVGGGGGGGTSAPVAGSGGSGGGGVRNFSNVQGNGTPGQGNNGGSAANANTGSGGGGAGAVGGNSTASKGGAGGAGIANASVGNLLTLAGAGVGGFIAGGGAGGVIKAGDTAGVGGSGGGGAGGSNSVTAGAGAPNTGSGGAGTGTANNATGGNGGSGIVIVAYNNTAVTGTSIQTPVINGPTTFTMTTNNAASNLSNQCSVTVNTPAAYICTNAPFGNQTSLPAGASVVSGTTCACNAATPNWDGFSCNAAAPPPPPSTPSVTLSGPTRVRSGTKATLTYTVANPPALCSISAIDANGTSYTNPSINPSLGTFLTNPITANTRFTLTCGAVSVSANVGIIPNYIEQ